MAGLWPCLAVAVDGSDALGPDGFPANWQATDFEVGGAVSASVALPLPTAAVAARLPVAETSASVMVSESVAVTPTAPRKLWQAVDGLGVLKFGSGGETPDVWRKMPWANAEAVLDKAAARGVASPALKEGWRRLLLTEAAPPQRADITGNWLVVRSRTLEALGLYEAAWALWHEVPQDALAVTDMAGLQAWARMRLLAGESAEACAVAKKAAVGGDSAAWASLMAVCQVVGMGTNPMAAQLSLQVVEPQLKNQNPSLLRILTAVQDGKPVTVLPNPTAMVEGLGGAVLGQYPALAGAGIMPRLPDVTLRRLSKSPDLPAEMRGQAALALARMTGLAADAKLTMQLISLTNVVGTLPDAVIVADVPNMETSDKVDAVPLYVGAALRLGMVDDAAKVFPQWLVSSTAPQPAQRARVQAELLLNALQAKDVAALWPQWLDAQQLQSQTGVKQAQRALLALDAVGANVPDALWEDMRTRAVAVSAVADPAWRRLLDKAADDENVPQVLGLITEAWAGQPPAAVAPDVLGESLRALKRIGMEDVVRRVAAEAILGIPESHLLAIKPPVLPEGVPVKPEATVFGASALAKEAAPVVSATLDMLPPPRVEPVSKPTVAKPTVKAPVKPVVPKVGL